MQNLLINIQFNYEKTNRKITLGNISSNETYYKVSSLQEKYQDFGCFFKFLNSPLQTQFDLTKARDCKLIIFDKDLSFVSLRYYFNHQNAPFSFLISDPYVIILPSDNKWTIEGIQSIEIKESPEVIGGNHFFATDSEKVEIIATDPYRFYLTFNVWKGRGLNRIEILDEILQNAKGKENYVLCERIIEVKELLHKKPEYQITKD